MDCQYPVYETVQYFSNYLSDIFSEIIDTQVNWFQLVESVLRRYARTHDNKSGRVLSTALE